MLTAPIVATVVVSISTVILGLFTFLNNPRRKVNILFLLMTLVVAVSLPAQNIGEYADLTRVTFWARVDSGFSMLGNAVLLLLICNFPRRLFSRTVEIIYGVVSALMVALSLTPLMIVSGTSRSGVVALTTGSLMPLYYVADTVYILLVIPALVIQYRRGRSMDRMRVKYLFYGGVLGLLVSALGLWLPEFFHIYRAVNYVPYVALVAFGLVAYDIVALRLFNIRFVVARSVAYTLLLASFAAAYYVLALRVSALLLAGTRLEAATQTYQVVVALVLAFSFQPLRRFFEKVTDGIFYRDRYDTQEVVNGFSRILVSELNIEPLLRRCLVFLGDQLHIKSGRAIIYDQKAIFADVSHDSRRRAKISMVDLAELRAGVMVAEELAEGDAARLMMDQNDIRLSVRLTSQGEEIGVLLLGDKLSGDIFTNQDVGVLEIIRQELAVAVQNARAYRQLQDAQEKLRETDKMKSEFIALSSHN